MNAALTPSEFERYSRHLLLPEVGVAGQERLKSSSVLIIGMGGLGNPVALYLAAAGVGHLGMMDDDTVDASNLQRQVLFDERALEKRKVSEAKRRIRSLNSQVSTTLYPFRATRKSLGSLEERYDLVVDGTDTFATRYLVNDWCVDKNVPLVYASISQFEGQASVFATSGGPCYRCLFPEPPPSHLIPSCAEGGVLGVLPGLLGVIQATEALKLLLGIGEGLAGRLLLIDALGMRFREVSVARDPACPSCGSGRIQHHTQHETPPREHPSHELSMLDVQDLLTGEKPVLLIDVRSEAERKTHSIGGLHVPLDEVPGRLDEIKSVSVGTTVIVYCQSGVRSVPAADMLVAAGVDAYSLQGGLNAWRTDASVQTMPDA